MELNKRYTGKVFDSGSHFIDETFNEFDFTNTDFNSAIFDHTSFKNSVFDKTKLKGSKLYYESDFDACTFIKIDFSNTTFGSHQGVYRNCTFEKCHFKSKEFNFTQFINCRFIDCKFKSLNFNGSTFKDCILSGTFEDVSFNGIYDINPDPTACLKNVDFSNARLGEFVSFFNCDLSSTIPPAGKNFNELLYQFYSDEPTVRSTGSKDRIVVKGGMDFRK